MGRVGGTKEVLDKRDGLAFNGGAAKKLIQGGTWLKSGPSNFKRGSVILDEAMVSWFSDKPYFQKKSVDHFWPLKLA